MAENLSGVAKKTIQKLYKKLMKSAILIVLAIIVVNFPYHTLIKLFY